MKEQMSYVAIDADNVGESIGNAVLSNDVDQLSSISNNINSGIGIFSQWAQYNGGKVISSGSDEAVFQVPIKSIDDLEKLKEEYQNKTGFSVSIGIGDTVSNAAKALIYAKMNGKNQVTDYSPEIERVMKQIISGNLDDKISEKENQLEGGVGDDIDPETLPQDELEEGVEHEKEHTDDEDIAEEIATDHLTEDDDYYSDLQEMEDEDEDEETEDEETEEIKVPKDEIDGDYGSEEMAEAQPEHEKEMSEEEEFIHDAQENREDELDDDIIEADEEDTLEEPISEDEAMDQMMEDGDEDIDLDGRPDIQEEHGEIDPEIDDLDQDGDVEHEEAMAAESEDEEDYNDEDDFEDEIESEKPYNEDDLESTIAQQMGNENFSDENSIEEQDDTESLDHQALKDVIYESLNIFRQNKEYLNAMQQENPELYTSLIHTLQAMIEMAKELGYGDAAEEMEAEDSQMENQFFENEDETANSEMPYSEEEIDIEKTEAYVRLIQKMKKTFQMLKSDDPKTIEETKDVVKKKKEQLKKDKNKKILKKRKISAKKPVIADKKKKKKENKKDNDGSFCARSHQKMRAAGKDCRSNEDKNSPLCSARKKFNCRGKNEEKGPVINKSEKLSKFLKKKELEKGREGTATKQTTKHVSKPHHPEGTQKGYKVKVMDNETGQAKWVDGSRGLAKDPKGDPIGPGGQSPVSIKKPKSTKIPKMDKI